VGTELAIKGDVCNFWQYCLGLGAAGIYCHHFLFSNSALALPEVVTEMSQKWN